MLVKQLAELFSGLDRAHGVYALLPPEPGQAKRPGRASTVLEKTTLKHWEAHVAGKEGLGIIPIKDDATCSWGAIDVDVYPSDIEQVEARCKQLNLPLVPCKTKSGGIHLFLFLKPGVSATLVRSRLNQFSARLGYPGVEIFPKQSVLASERDVGNWLNMPYYGGDKTDRYAVIGGKKASLERFIKRAFKLQVDASQLELVQLSSSDFDDGPPCLQALTLQGFPQGTRNTGLFALGVYARLKFADAWELKVDKFNVAYLKPPLPNREVATIIKGLGRKSYFYPCDKPPCVNHCDKALCRTREFGIGTAANDDLGVVVGGLVKIDSNPPTWITDVDGVRIELDSEEMLSQEKFRRRCMDRINKLPSRVKAPTWEKLIQTWLANVEIQEAPPDSGIEGQFLVLLEQFCTSVSQSKIIDEILTGKPYTKDGRIMFRSRDLERFLDQQHFRHLSTKQIWAVLRRKGASHTQLNLKGRCVQCWSVADYAQQDSDFDVPDAAHQED